jgi:hypothetical protein
MNIRELTGYKSNPLYQQAKTDFSGDLSMPNDRINTLVQFQKYLTTLGFQPMMGSPGQGGTAFEHPNYPWVFKVFTHDPGYVDFINFAKQNQSNPHIIKIKGGLLKINPQTFAVRLEKLQKGSGEDFNRMIKILGHINELSDIDFIDDNHPDWIEYLKTNHPAEFKIVHTLATQFPNHTLDLHRGNILMRGSTIVFSDPLV